MSEEIRREARSRYSHANVKDRYDADLLMAGFQDGAEWALAQLASPTEEELRAIAAARGWIESGGPGVRVLRILVAMAERGTQVTDQPLCVCHVDPDGAVYGSDFCAVHGIADQSVGGRDE